MKEIIKRFINFMFQSFNAIERFILRIIVLCLALAVTYLFIEFQTCEYELTRMAGSFDKHLSVSSSVTLDAFEIMNAQTKAMIRLNSQLESIVNRQGKIEDSLRVTADTAIENAKTLRFRREEELKFLARMSKQYSDLANKQKLLEARLKVQMDRYYELLKKLEELKGQ